MSVVASFCGVGLLTFSGAKLGKVVVVMMALSRFFFFFFDPLQNWWGRGRHALFEKMHLGKGVAKMLHV